MCFLICVFSLILIYMCFTDLGYFFQILTEVHRLRLCITDRRKLCAANWNVLQLKKPDDIDAAYIRLGFIYHRLTLNITYLGYITHSGTVSHMCLCLTNWGIEIKVTTEYPQKDVSRGLRNCVTNFNVTDPPVSLCAYEIYRSQLTRN